MEFVFADVCCAIERCCLLNQILWASECCRHAKNLTWLALVAAIDVVIAALRAYYHIGYLQRRVHSASHTGRHNKVGVVEGYHLGGSNSRVYLADATLLHHNLVVGDASGNKLASAVNFFFHVGGYGCELCKLLVHCHNYTYLHYYLILLLCLIGFNRSFCYVLSGFNKSLVNAWQSYKKKAGPV